MKEEKVPRHSQKGIKMSWIERRMTSLKAEIDGL